MGIRVSKAVGYGVRGFKPTPEQRDRMENATLTSLKEFASANEREIVALDQSRRGDRTFSIDLILGGGFKLHERMVHFDDEFGIRDALLLAPPEGIDWCRYDNTIDWLEETERTKDGTANRWKWLRHGIYPNNRGQPSITVAALCLYLGIPDEYPKLREALYVYWS